MQPQPLEGMPQHELGALRAQPAVPGVALADRDVEQHRPVVDIERGERGEAHKALGRQLEDRVGQRIRR